MEDFKQKKVGNTTVLHDPKTNQPVYVVSPANWGRETYLRWHPSMHDIHPQLKDSHEFGNPAAEGNGSYEKTYKNKSEAISSARGRYPIAARMGFRDAIEKHHENVPDDEFEQMKSKFKEHRHGRYNTTPGEMNDTEQKTARTITHYVDPDTGDRIITSKYDPVDNKIKSTMHSNYLLKHGIDSDVASTLVKKHQDTYNQAKALYYNKGKQARLTGKEMGDAKFKSYKITTTPEEASQAHEEKVKQLHKGITINRITPHTFIGTNPPENDYSTGHHVMSHVDPATKTLHTTTSELKHPSGYTYKKNTEIIESFLADPMAFFEEAPANAVSAGAIKGTGGLGGEPGVVKTKYSRDNKRLAPKPLFGQNQNAVASPVMNDGQMISRKPLSTFREFFER